MFDLYLARELVLLSSNSNRIGYTHMFNLFVHATKLFKLISCTVGIRKLDMSGFRVDGLVQVLNGVQFSNGFIWFWNGFIHFLNGPDHSNVGPFENRRQKVRISNESRFRRVGFRIPTVHWHLHKNGGICMLGKNLYVRVFVKFKNNYSLVHFWIPVNNFIYYAKRLPSRVGFVKSLIKISTKI